MQKTCKLCATEETWKPVVGWEGMYEVSSIGRVKSLKRKRGYGTRKSTRLRKLNIKHGYATVELSKDHKMFHHKVARLVSIAFIPNDKSLPIVNHKDCNRNHDCVSNLEWCTYKQNTQHAIANNRWSSRGVRGAKHPKAKITEDQVRQIRIRLKVERVSDIAREFHLTSTSISHIRDRKNWAHVH